jgi:hypothetical protein
MLQVPRMLTIDQKQQCVDDSEQCLAIFNRNKDGLSVDILQWMKHGCFTSLQSPIDSQPGGLNAINRIRSVWKNATVSWQGYGISILGCAWYYIHRLPQKGP